VNGLYAPRPRRTLDGTGTRSRSSERALSAFICGSKLISNFLVEKTMLLRGDSAGLRFNTDSPIKAAILSVSLEAAPRVRRYCPHRIDFRPWRYCANRIFQALWAMRHRSSWPHATLGNTPLDLRQVLTSIPALFISFTGPPGIRLVRNHQPRQRPGLRVELRSDVLSSCWLFATHGGWRDLNVAVLEPATGYPFQMQSMIAEGRARRLGPGESLKTSVHFYAQEGLPLSAASTRTGLFCPAKRIRLYAPTFAGAGSSDSRIAAAIATTAPAICIPVSLSCSSATASTL